MLKKDESLAELVLQTFSQGTVVLYVCEAFGDYAPSFITPNIQSQLGYTDEEFLAKPDFWASHIHPDDRERIFNNLGNLFEPGYHTHEYRFQHKNGSYRWMHDQLTLRRDATGTPVEIVGYWLDITTRKRMEQALTKAKETAELANTSKTRFLAAASHDLRQPLQAIASHTDLLAISNTDPTLAKSIKQLGDATLAMQELLEALLDITKLETGTMRPELRTFSVSTLLGQLEVQYKSIVMEKGLTLKFIPCTAVVRSDPTLLRVILQNLISNAIKYTHRGKVIIGCRHRGDRISIEVWDSGIGIPEDEQGAIFEEFYQLDNPARDRNKGVGIGLTIVKRIADLLNHPLYMHSIVGKGSSFAIQVPFVNNAREETYAAQPETAKSDNESTGSSILLIEDDEIVLHANYGLLKMLGYKVNPASDAEAAMQYVASESPLPEIIISDYRLPGDSTGTELVQQLRTKAGSLIPAIILTGDITIPDDNNKLPDKSLLLQKPARVEELVQAINQLLENPVPSAE
jgi:two-component system CheB/CheR fusion protein